MNKTFSSFEPCGIEVSARTLLVALGGENRAASQREFPNTPKGHQEVLRFLERWGGRGRGGVESTGP